MRNRKTLLAVLTVACLAALPVLDGCSDSAARRAGQKIRNEVALAQRLGQRANALLANTVYEDLTSGRITPLDTADMKATEPDKIKVLPPGTLNDDALKALQEARDGGDDHPGLLKVLSENSGAPAEDLALGCAALGQIESLLGAFHASKAALARRNAAASAMDAQAALSLVRAQADLLRGFERLAAADDASLAAEIAKADTAIADLTARKAKADGDIAKVNADLDALRKATDTLISQASTLIIASEAAGGQKKVDLYDEATKVQQQVTANSSRIAALEQALKAHRVVAETIALDLAGANARKAAAQGILASRKTARDSAAEQKAKIAEELANLQKRFETTAGAVADALAEASESAKAAQDFYVEQSAKSFRKAAQAAPSREALVGQAQALQSAARGTLWTLQCKAMLLPLVEQARQVWAGLNQPLPPAIAKIQTFAPDLMAMRQAAADRCAEAVKLYKQVLAPPYGSAQAVPDQMKWSYQAQLAGAYLGVYQLATKDADRTAALDEARKLLAEAVKEKASSPYLQDVVRMKEVVDRTPPTAPDFAGELPAPEAVETAPATPPAAPPATAPATLPNVAP